MLQPQLSVDERMEGAGVSDMSYEKHFLEHFHKELIFAPIFPPTQSSN